MISVRTLDVTLILMVLTAAGVSGSETLAVVESHAPSIEHRAPQPRSDDAIHRPDRSPEGRSVPCTMVGVRSPGEADSTTRVQAGDATTDESCGWLRDFVPGGFDDTAVAMAVYDDGSGSKLYVAGDFRHIGADAMGGFARWDGVRWEGVGNPPSGQTYALAVFDNRLVAAGSYRVGDDPPTYRQFLEWDGSQWSIPDWSLGGDYPFISVLAIHDGCLWAAGKFDSVNGVETENVARLCGDAWSSVGAGLPARVTAMKSFGAYGVVAVGWFSSSDLYSSGGIARWTGSAWEPVGRASNLHPTGFHSIEMYQGELYASGSFRYDGSWSSQYIAVLRHDQWRELPGEVPESVVYLLHEFDGKLVVTGNYWRIDNHYVNGVVTWDGSEWAPLGEGLFGPVNDFQEYQGKLFADGTITLPGSLGPASVVSWDGSIWDPIQSVEGAGLPWGGGPLGVYRGQLIAASGVSWSQDTGPGSVVRWTGSGWEGFGGGVFGTIEDVHVINDDLYIAGDFHVQLTHDYGRLAVWNGDYWRVIDGFTGRPRTLGSYEQHLVVSGDRGIFLWIRNHWEPLGDVRGAVSDFREYRGRLIAAGWIWGIQNDIGYAVAAWDGHDWVNVRLGPIGTAYALAEFHGKLIVGGSFDRADFVDAKSIATWDGSQWSTLGSGFESSSSEYALVSDLAVVGDSLVAGGEFSSADGEGANNIAVWDGSGWQPVGEGVDGEVTGLAAFGTGFFAAGDFMSAGGNPSHRIAQFACDDGTIAPTPPDVTSVPVASTWSRIPDVHLTLEGSEDDVAVLGYSVEFDHHMTTDPDSVIEHPHATWPDFFSQRSLADGDDWYGHVRACDLAANCSETVHVGPLWIDATPPDRPSDLFSSSHVPGEASTDDTVELGWTASIDATSGVDRYRVGFDASAASSACDQLPLEVASPTITTSPLLDGTWYGHVCAVDRAGNPSPVATLGPFVIATPPPTVVGLSSAAATWGGRIADGGRVGVSLTQLGVVFRKPMRDPVGSSSPGDVTAAQTYRLVRLADDGAGTGPNCIASLSPGDEEVAIGSVRYLADDWTAWLEIAGEKSLVAGDYSLTVCGSAADMAGNGLDGNGDGVPGDDHVRRFRVLRTSLLNNPNFDGDLTGWAVQAATGGTVVFGPDDADGVPTSGSALIDGVTGPSQVTRLRQCVEGLAAGVHLATARARVLSMARARIQIKVTTFTEAECVASLGGVETFETERRLDGTIVPSRWVPMAGEVAIPDGTRSVELIIQIIPVDEATALQVEVDRVSLAPQWPTAAGDRSPEVIGPTQH